MRVIPAKSVNRPPPMIKGFYVRNLFGLYSYESSLPDTSDERGERLILIYGDNGSGKTTIVNLIYHLLSRSDAQGHRTFIANTQFDEFGIIFSDNRTVIAQKQDKSGLGPYRLRLESGGRVTSEVDIFSQQRDGDFFVRSKDVDDIDLEAFFDDVFQTELDCFYLSDSREFHSDHFRKDTSEEAAKRRAYNELLHLEYEN